MSKFRECALLLTLVALAAAPQAEAVDAARGEKVFRQCVACHSVGASAKHKLGPELNEVIGRTAGAAPGYKYSSAMKAAGKDGLIWSDKTLDEYLANPRAFVKGTKMSFAGLKKERDRADLVAYLQTFSRAAQKTEPSAPQTAAREPAAALPKMERAPSAAARPMAATAEIPKHGTFHLGRRATPAEIRAWDIDIRPDGAGLPPGEGSVADGEKVFTERCASCHGDFGEGRDRWPVLAGGMDSLKADRPVKTVGSYWPYLSTVFDYVRRSMPFGDARSLSDNDVYALTAYVLFLNNLVKDDFTLSAKNFTTVQLPNEANFIPDDRAAEPEYANKGEPCMTDCKPAPAKVIMRARVLDVTPDSKQGEERPAGSVE